MTNLIGGCLKIKMENKIWLILIFVVLVGFTIIFIGGTISKNILFDEGDYDKIESLEEVISFLEDCNNKLFLNCELLLRRRIKE